MGFRKHVGLPLAPRANLFPKRSHWAAREKLHGERNLALNKVIKNLNIYEICEISSGNLPGPEDGLLAEFRAVEP